MKISIKVFFSITLVCALLVNPGPVFSQDDDFVGLPPRGELKDFLRGEKMENKSPVEASNATPKVENNNFTNRIEDAHRKDNVMKKSYKSIYIKEKKTDKITKRKPRILRVGVGEEYTLPSQAARNTVDGDIVEIDAAGNYEGDTARWISNNLTIKGVNGRPHITSKNKIPNGKALWVIGGNNITVENIEFSGARVSDKNGAGIRFEGTNLIVRNSYFHHNQNGILTGANPLSSILLEYNEFAYNGGGEGRTHNMYIGKIKELTVRFNYIHHANIGHNIKTRARSNFILYNKIMDGWDGAASYQIDLPNGGEAYVIGNVIQQGERADNWSMISFGVEGYIYDNNELILIHNTLVNDRHSGEFLRVRGNIDVMMINNIFAGAGRLLGSRRVKSTNLVKKHPIFVSRDKFDYHLKSGSQAIDKGDIPPTYKGIKLRAEYEYMHKANKKIRTNIGRPDYGAFEFSP